MVGMNWEEDIKTYEEAERERRNEFFKVLGVDDDGRVSAIMTEEEWRMFSYGKPFNRINYAKDTAGKHFVRVYFAFEPYHDVTYSYCVDDGCIYENRMYIGE